VFVALSLSWGAVHAQNFRSGDSTRVGAGETVDGTLWASGRTIDVAGRVNGDVFCAGQNVTITGTVNGDVLCAAQTIVISGTVTGNVRSMAQTITLTGAVGHNLSTASQNFNQTGKSNVKGDASIGANDATVSGTVGRDAAIGSKTIFVGGQIGRNVQAATDRLELGPGAMVSGDVDYTSNDEIYVDKGAQIKGTTTQHKPQQHPTGMHASSLFGLRLGFGLYVLVAGLIVTLALVLLIPQAIHAVTSQGIRSPWKALLVGLIASIVVPIIILILLFTLVGIPLALLLLVAWILVEALSGVMAAYYLGRLIWRRQRNPVLIMLLGTVLLAILYFIPIISFIAFVLATLIGIGMIVLELMRRRPAPRYNTSKQVDVS
jgi:cytoskeletal protein CcmA (bactofilin family)